MQLTDHKCSRHQQWTLTKRNIHKIFIVTGYSQHIICRQQKFIDLCQHGNNSNSGQDQNDHAISFETYHAKQQSITNEHCPTAIMLADFFTKPLQGSLFRMYRSVLLGEVPHSTLSITSPMAGNEEHVEQENPDGPGDITPHWSTSIAAAATDASHSFEMYPMDARLPSW
jgi:hypothetical protein